MTRIIAAFFLSISLLCACSGSDSPISSAYRYDHTDRMAQRYAVMLTNAPLTDYQLQFRLMDISSRFHALNVEGDSLLALFFRLSIEDKVRAIDPAMADSIFRHQSIFPPKP